MSSSLDRGAEHRCQHCGRHVTAAFARVHGDNDDIVHRCLGCDCYRRVCRGSAAGVDVDMPDPDDELHQNRNRGQRVSAASDATRTLTNGGDSK
jgi:hypothetical protein